MSVYHDHHGVEHQKPDNEPINWRPSAYGILENEKGEWLMVQPTWSERLDLPGGGVEPDETLKEGLVREFFEETGYQVAVDEQPIYVGDRNFLHKIMGYCHTIVLVHRVKLINKDRDASVVNKLEDEIADMKWVHPSDLKEEEVSVIHWPVIKKYGK